MTSGHMSRGNFIYLWKTFEHFDRIEPTGTQTSLSFLFLGLSNRISYLLRCSFAYSVFKRSKFVIEGVLVLYFGNLNATKKGANTSPRVNVQLLRELQYVLHTYALMRNMLHQIMFLKIHNIELLSTSHL